jgi:hypothetical protein
MLYEYFEIGKNIIKSVLYFAEHNPIVMGVIAAVWTSSLWLRKLIKQKRAEAFFGFYTHLLLRIKVFESWLDEHRLLNCKNKDAGNVYTFIYQHTIIGSECSGFLYKDVNNYAQLLEEMEKMAQDLKKVIIESKSNVYPQKCNKKTWYESQYVLVSFCDYVIDKKGWGETKKAKYEEGRGRGKYVHVVKCEELIDAMHFLRSSIERSIY